MPVCLSWCCSFDHLFVWLFWVVEFVDALVGSFQLIEKDNLVTALVELAKEVVELGKHEFIVVDLNEFEKLLLFELVFLETEGVADMISNRLFAIVEIVLELVENPPGFARESFDRLYLHPDVILKKV